MEYKYQHFRLKTHTKQNLTQMYAVLLNFSLQILVFHYANINARLYVCLLKQLHNSCTYQYHCSDVVSHLLMQFAVGMTNNHEQRKSLNVRHWFNTFLSLSILQYENVNILFLYVYLNNYLKYSGNNIALLLFRIFIYVCYQCVTQYKSIRYCLTNN